MNYKIKNHNQNNTITIATTNTIQTPIQSQTPLQSQTPQNEPQSMELSGMGSSFGSEINSNLGSSINGSNIENNSLPHPKMQHTSDTEDVSKLYEKANQMRMKEDTQLAPDNPYHPKSKTIEPQRNMPEINYNCNKFTRN